MTTTNPRIGSSFESFLDEEGITGECTATAIKRVLARIRQRAARANPAEFDALLDSFGNDDPPQDGDELDESFPPPA